MNTQPLDDVVLLPAHELASKIHGRELSCREVM